MSFYPVHRSTQQQSQPVFVDLNFLLEEKTDEAAQRRFLCANCGQSFKSLSNLRNHHWCISDENIIRAAQQANRQYEEELRNQMVFQTYQPPSTNVYDYSPPLGILSFLPPLIPRRLPPIKHPPNPLNLQSSMKLPAKLLNLNTTKKF